MMNPDLLIVGPSVRAAAASAIRAGLQPHCVDLFADSDLVRACVCRRMAMDQYPQALPAELAKLPRMPYMFLGGLENQWSILDAIDRPRWGMQSKTLRNLRDPLLMGARFVTAGLWPIPVFHWDASISNFDPDCTWLLKPRHGAAGHGVRFVQPGEPFDTQTHLVQKYVEGAPASAVFAASSSGRPRLLGVTRQLIGTPWLRSSGFRYAGNVGPWPVSQAVVELLEKAARMLPRSAFSPELRGLFGIDFILRDHAEAFDKVSMVEVNPRYPASVEVLERTSGDAFLVHHRAAFDPADVLPMRRSPSAKFAGKGILYAKETLEFPKRGPWMEAFDYALDDLAVPYADIPHPGDRIEKGQPVLTMFASADDHAACMDRLREKAAFVEDRLFSAAK
ncbi:MAG: ATP-grasp domain-containing protein [Gemmataceae bacterium]|nr:ATP-grasp domain-containing protein [Gemmataceae bacterium]